MTNDWVNSTELNFCEKFADKFLGSELGIRVRHNDSRDVKQACCRTHPDRAQKRASQRLFGRYPFRGVNMLGQITLTGT